MSIPFAAFGPGILIVTRTDTTIPVAINVGYAQELTLDFAGNTKQLYGQNQYPLVAARSTVKSTGKWKSAVCSAVAWNAAFYGGTFSTANSLNWNVGSTFTMTSTMSSTGGGLSPSTAFDADLGVTFSTIGTPLLRASSTALGSSGAYAVSSVTPGLYYFNTTDAAAGYAIKITYTNLQSTTGQNLVVTNQPIGFTPTFQLDYYTTLSQPTARPMAIRLYACVASKHTLAFKLEDFMMPEFDFDIFADSQSRVVGYSFPEIS